MRFKTIERLDKDIDLFEQMNREAFPDHERLTLDQIFTYVDKLNTDFVGMYDGTVPIGFFVLIKNSKCGYLNYFAIDQSMRSQGYGSRALNLLMDTYPDLQIILDFEGLDPNSTNYEQRIARKNFYLRNGFYQTNYYTMVKDEKYDVVCSQRVLNVHAFLDLIHHMHRLRHEFVDDLFVKEGSHV